MTAARAWRWLLVWLSGSLPLLAFGNVFEYRQEPASLATQLAEVSRNHGLNLIYPAATAGGELTAGLNGHYSLEQALDQLLQQRGLRWRLVKGAVRIEAKPALLRLEVGQVDMQAWSSPPISSQGPVAAPAGEPPALLARRTAAGWTFTEPALRALPNADLGRWLSRSPNAYGQGSRLSLRGIERDSFSAQTSTVQLNGLPLSARALDAALPLPAGLAQIDFALGPQPERLSTPGFAGELGVLTEAPVPLNRGSARLGAGFRNERRLDLGQSLDLQSAGATQLVWIERQREGQVRHADGRPLARDRIGLLRWLLEPESWPELTVSADLLWLRARPADERLTPPLGDSGFDPELRSDREPARRLALDEYGVRLGASYRATSWIFDTSHQKLDSRERIRAESVLLSALQFETAERSRVHQFAASRERPGSPWRLRLALDQARREADFFTTDQLPLIALFPTAGGFKVSEGSFRSLRTGVEQQIRSRGAQFWLGAQWSRWQLETGTSWLEERRHERSSLLRTLSPGCQLTDRQGLTRDCRIELPEISRANSLQARDRRFTPAATVLFRDAHAGQLGLQWRRGARSGGARPAAGQVLPFRPERSDTFEFSWRTLAWRGLSARLALFRNFWRDRQVQLLDPGQPGFAIVNAGRARASGGELTLAAQLPDDWQLALGIGQLRTRFERFQLPGPGAPVDLAGREFPGAPRRTAVLSLTRSPDRGLEFGVLLHAASRAQGDPFNRPVAVLPGRAELEVRVGWRSRDFTVALEMQNALDHDHLEQVLVSAVDAQPRSYLLGAPRQLRTTLEWRW